VCGGSFWARGPKFTRDYHDLFLTPPGMAIQDWVAAMGSINQYFIPIKGLFGRHQGGMAAAKHVPLLHERCMRAILCGGGVLQYLIPMWYL
jgi:hypothetical protein